METKFGKVTHFSPMNFTVQGHTLRLLFYIIKLQNCVKFGFNLFLCCKSRRSIKQQISKLYPQTLSTEASCYINDRPVTDINVIAGLCALTETETRCYTV